MVGVEFWGDVDLASVSIWLFWLFFAGLIYYLQTENQREGYPLVDDDGNAQPGKETFPLPSPKTFRLPHGQGDLVVPSPENEARHARANLALARSSASGGSPYVPTGDPMADGVGPASWVPRADVPELDAHGKPKLRPLSLLPDFSVTAGRDPRRLAVVSGDGEVVGRVTDLWIDVPEQMVRYLTIDLNPENTGRTRVVPIYLARIGSDRVTIRSLYAHNFEGIPTAKDPGELTKLEEDKITGYVAGGILYADPRRLEPQI